MHLLCIWNPNQAGHSVFLFAKSGTCTRQVSQKPKNQASQVEILGEIKSRHCAYKYLQGNMLTAVGDAKQHQTWWKKTGQEGNSRKPVRDSVARAKSLAPELQKSRRVLENCFLWFSLSIAFYDGFLQSGLLLHTGKKSGETGKGSFLTGMEACGRSTCLDLLLLG